MARARARAVRRRSYPDAPAGSAVPRLGFATAASYRVVVERSPGYRNKLVDVLAIRRGKAVGCLVWSTKQRGARSGVWRDHCKLNEGVGTMWSAGATSGGRLSVLAIQSHLSKSKI